MNYSEPDFLVLFALFFAIYSVLGSDRPRRIALFVASILFYAYGDPGGIPVLLSVIAVTYVAGLAVDRWRDRAARLTTAAVTLLVLDLGVFKYAVLANDLAGGRLELPHLVAPLGISFYTFEAIAYLVDLKRGMTEVERSPLALGLFIGVFPHLISGPIMRPDDLLPQLHAPIRLDRARMLSGAQLFVEGLVKKRLLADPAGMIVDTVYAAPATAGTVETWTAVLAYTIQIYGDFAGYTDMGRGIARILGLELPLNFNAPFTAHSITEFWQRWHMSLSSWLRDYLWVALGGLRRGRWRPYTMVILTMLIGGLWHGASLTFVAWGGLHGVLMAFERRFRWWLVVPRPLALGLTLFLIVNAFALFRAQTFSVYLDILQGLYAPRTAGGLVSGTSVLLVVAFFLGVLGLQLAQRHRPLWLARARSAGAWSAWAYVGATVVVLGFAPTTVRPFIYFRF